MRTRNQVPNCAESVSACQTRAGGAFMSTCLRMVSGVSVEAEGNDAVMGDLLGRICRPGSRIMQPLGCISLPSVGSLHRRREEPLHHAVVHAEARDLALRVDASSRAEH